MIFTVEWTTQAIKKERERIQAWPAGIESLIIMHKEINNVWYFVDPCQNITSLLK